MQPLSNRTEEGQIAIRTTLQDVARSIGVHHTTVSRALRNDPQISEKMRNKVNKAAEALGYKPDPMLQALARYRGQRREATYQGTLAWLSNSVIKNRQAKSSGGREFQVAAERALQKGYRFESFDLNAQGMTPGRIRTILSARGIRGILLPPQDSPDTVISMDLSGFSCVTIGNTLVEPILHRVGPSQFDNSRLLAAHLLADPGLRVGFYLPKNLDERSEGQFSAGFWRAQQEIPQGRRIPIYLPKQYDEASFAKWFKRNQLNAIVSSPQPIVEWLGRLKVHVPKDVLIAFPGDPPVRGEFLHVSENWDEIYRAAVEFLVSQLERNYTGVPVLARKILVQGSPAGFMPE